MHVHVRRSVRGFPALLTKVREVCIIYITMEEKYLIKITNNYQKIFGAYPTKIAVISEPGTLQPNPHKRISPDNDPEQDG